MKAVAVWKTTTSEIKASSGAWEVDVVDGSCCVVNNGLKSVVVDNGHKDMS
jgi:hypothetical protein